MTHFLAIFVEIILPLALVWLVGFLGRRLLHLDPQPFSRAGLYLLTPAVIFSALMESEVTGEESGRILLVVALLAGGLWLLSTLEARLLRLSGEDRSAFLLTSMFINTVNYGFPVALLAFGQAGLERAAVFSIGHALLANTVGAYIAARGRAGGIRQTLRQILRIPMLYAVALALILRAAGISFTGTISLGEVEIALLPTIYRAIRLLSQAAIPVFMLVLGMQLGNQDHHPTDPQPPICSLFAAGVNRLVLSPLLAWGLVRLIGLTGLAAQVSILDASLPSAVLTVILALEFDTRPRLVTLVVFWTTLCSMLTVTLLLGWLK